MTATQTSCSEILADGGVPSTARAEEDRSPTVRGPHAPFAQSPRASASVDLELLFEQVPVAIAILRVPDLVYERTNPSYRALMGGRDSTGTSPHQAVPEREAQEIERIVAEVCRARASFAVRAKLVRVTDVPGRSSDRYFDLIYQPIFDANGDVHQVAAIGFDVTDVVAARRAAEDATHMKEQFLAMVSHELRSCISPILTALELLRLKHGECQPERGIIERRATHVARLVDDLLDVARIEQGKVELRLSRVDISHVLLAAIETTRPRLRERGQQLELHCAGGLTVHADAQRLAQVVSNLLANASKYSEHGQSVELSATRGDRGIVVRVRDSGIGITSEMLPRVFEAFVQDRHALHRSRGGLGLGLAIAKSIVEMHHGTIEVRSGGVGLGSEFAVRLPEAA
jgi:signal transduction histidine kinase